MFRFIFYLVANIIMTLIELPFDYENGFELLFGYVYTTAILGSLNFCFYKIAYNYVGWYAALTDAGYEEKSCLHWFIRFILSSILYAVTYIPAVSSFLTYIIHLSYTFCESKYDEIVQEILDVLIH